jgi:hypothetical protein
MSRDFDSRRTMRYLLPDSEPHSLIVFRPDDQRHALRRDAAERVARAVEIPDTFLSTDESEALKEALVSQRNS